MAAMFKQEAHKLIDNLPETASWDDLAEQVDPGVNAYFVTRCAHAA